MAAGALADLRQPHIVNEGRTGHRPVAGQQHIALAQLDGIELERLRHFVHQAFDGVEGLGAAEAAHGSRDDPRARHGRGVDHDLVEAIAAAAGEGGELGDPLAVVVGAAGLQAHPARNRLEPAGGIDRETLLDDAPQLLQPGGELLEAVVGDAHRPVGIGGGQRQQHGKCRGVAAAEAAAGIAGVQHHLGESDRAMPVGRKGPAWWRYRHWSIACPGPYAGSRRPHPNSSQARPDSGSMNIGSRTWVVKLAEKRLSPGSFISASIFTRKARAALSAGVGGSAKGLLGPFRTWEKVSMLSSA